MTFGDDSRVSEIASFGPFRLTVTERLLAKGGEPVAVGGRALDLLIALIEQAGEVVSRRELIERAWPDVIVEEGSLRVHVANLRKALGDGQDGARYIVNVPGRGYCFVAPVHRSAATKGGLPVAAPATPPGFLKLPAPLPRMVGREETIAALASLLRSRRFVSIVGPGGMGKTTVAVAVAHALVSDFGEAICFVDLGSIVEPALVVTAVALAAGHFVHTPDLLPGLLAFLADKRMLLVLDNCEHLVDAVAVLTERLVSEAPLLHILTTTREALRIEGENVHLLLPLEAPRDDIELTAVNALTWPAVQLFMERAAASGHGSELSNDDAPIVARICRRLDGIALEIELVASQVGAYGIRGTADLLDSRFKLLWQGQRSAVPRHQTLRAMLDWSYNLLSKHEQKTLCRLSVFVGIFTLEGALSVVGESDADASIVAEEVASLVNKSLVSVLGVGGSISHRLLDTTRAYAAAKLVESGEEDAVKRCHALYYANHLNSDAIRKTAFGSSDMWAHSPHMGNVRAALEWSFSQSGDAAIGVELAALSARIFLGFSLLGECERWCEHGLAALQEPDRGTKRELALQLGLAISSMFTRGNSDKVRAAIDRGLGLAEALKDRNYHLHLLAGLNIFLVRIGDFPAALAVSQRSVAVAGEVGEPAGIMMVEWMLGAAHHLIGDQAAAQRHCERGLELAAARGRVHVDFFGYDHRVRALVALARALWLRGFPERALKFAHQAIHEASSRDHPVTACFSFVYTIPVFLWTGNFEGAAERIERLIGHAAKYSLEPYHAVGLALKGELMVARGEPAAGVQLLRGALATLNAERYHVLATVFYRALAEGLARCGQFDEASAMIARAVELAEGGGGRFDLPDLLRARAEILLAAPQPNLLAAEESLVHSLDWALKQSALGWELRTALPLARMWAEQGRSEDAGAMLASINQRFTEGFGTADLKAAGRLLAELRRGSPTPYTPEPD